MVCITGYETVKGFHVASSATVEYLMVDIEKGYKRPYEATGLVHQRAAHFDGMVELGRLWCESWRTVSYIQLLRVH